MKILFSNLGYAKGISGSLHHHLVKLGHHVYTPPKRQQQVLAQFRAIIDAEQPDICCLVEIDRGSFHSGYFNQIQALMCDQYCFHDIADKYGERLFSRLPLHWGKSNAFIARTQYPFRRHYFARGTKRLMYELILPDFTLFFAHFSLQRKVRTHQFEELSRLVQQTKREVAVLADFNILNGFQELKPLTENGLVLLNQQDEPTFTFHQRRLVLDLCLCSPQLAARAQLQIVPQPFSDHSALLFTFRS